MLGDILERVENARQALDGIKKALKRPEATRLPGIPLAKITVSLDRAAGQLVKQAAAVTAALEDIPPKNFQRKRPPNQP